VKLLKGNGSILEVWDVTKLVMRLRAGLGPIKCPGWQLLEDDQAREMVKRMIAEGAKGDKLR
jgi:hypothetical protein